VFVDKKAIFIINTSQLGPQIYDLVAHSIEEKKRFVIQTILPGLVGE